METSWPWLAVAGLGALHGLSPANGWMFAAASGVRERGGARMRRARVRWALVPIAMGHVASVAIVVCAFSRGILLDRALVQRLAGALLIGVASYRWLRRARPPMMRDRVARTCVGARAGHAGIALWSCLMATAHGTGLMLVPALVPLCTTDSPVREITASGSLMVMLAAVGVHMAAMVVTTGVIATGICHGVTLHPCLLKGTALRHAWSAALAVTGALLMTLH